MPRQFTPKVLCTCGHCGKQFARCPSQVAPYCGRVCFGLANRKRPTYTCDRCGKAFYPLMHRETTRYCSHSCASAATVQGETRQCAVCGTAFYIHAKRAASGKGGRYCSNACRLARHVAPVERRCEQCQRTFTTERSAIGRFCSRACMHANKRTGAFVPCIVCGATFWQYPSTMQQHCSRSCMGVSQRRANAKSRYTWRYNAWRKAVLDRDGFCCQHCGHQGQRVYKGGGMHAHHVKPYATYPRLRYAITNGITLCGLCHQTQHPTIPILRP